MIQKTNGKVKTAILTNRVEQMECYWEDSIQYVELQKQSCGTDQNKKNSRGIQLKHQQ